MLCERSLSAASCSSRVTVCDVVRTSKKRRLMSESSFTTLICISFFMELYLAFIAMTHRPCRNSHYDPVSDGAENARLCHPSRFSGPPKQEKRKFGRFDGLDGKASFWPQPNLRRARLKRIAHARKYPDLRLPLLTAQAAQPESHLKFMLDSPVCELSTFVPQTIPAPQPPSWPICVTGERFKGIEIMEKLLKILISEEYPKGIWRKAIFCFCKNK